MGYGEVIRKAREAKGLSQSELAEMIGVNRVAITNYELEKNAPTYENVKKLSQILNIPEQDLFDPTKKELIAREELHKNPKKYANELPELQLLQDMHRFPFVTIGAGAEAVLDVAVLESIYIPSELLPPNFNPKNVLIAKVLGDSMEPKFYENDIIFFDMVNGRNVMLTDGIYLVRYGDVVQLKSVQFLGNGDIRIISFNDSYPPIQPVKELGVDWEILGKPFLHWRAQMWARLQEK